MAPRTPSFWDEAEEEDQAPVANSAQGQPNPFCASAVSPPPGLAPIIEDEPMVAPDPGLGEGYARRLAEAKARGMSIEEPSPVAPSVVIDDGVAPEAPPDMHHDVVAPESNPTADAEMSSGLEDQPTEEVQGPSEQPMEESAEPEGEKENDPMDDGVAPDVQDQSRLPAVEEVPESPAETETPDASSEAPPHVVFPAPAAKSAVPVPKAETAPEATIQED